MKVVVIGAGMAGLSVGFMLKKHGIDVEVLESDSYAGGGAHSFKWHEHTCDWATHRLFTHNDHTLQQLLSLVPMNRIQRTSCVYLGGKWLKDPVDLIQLCTRFFPAKTCSIPYTYLTRNKKLPEDGFENYVYSHFGRSLGDFLFSPYTIKMFGIPAHEISVEWARKKVRIAGPLDVLKQGSKKKFFYFYYPKQGGYGAIPDRLRDELSGHITFGSRVKDLEIEGQQIKSVKYEQDGVLKEATGDLIISTLPLTTLCQMLGYECNLTYRAVSAVNLLINKPQVTPNHWIYFMDGDVAINRLCEFKNFDPTLGPKETTVICAEVTDRDHPDLESKIINDLCNTGLITKSDILDTKTVTRDYSYPVYRQGYEKDVDAAQAFLSTFSNLHWVGRAAQFEHMEIDDCFGAALQLSREIIKEQDLPIEVAQPQKRSTLAVEPQLAAIVASAGNTEDTLACLDSLTQSDYKQLNTYLVTDTSESELSKRVKEQFPQISILNRPEEMGIPAAFNLGCNHAMKDGADFVFLCLGQTTVETDTLSHMVVVAQRDPEAGILTPKILCEDQKDHIWSIGSHFRTFPPSIKTIGLRQRDDTRFTQSREVEFAVSSGLLVKREVLEKAGLFDPGYQFYYEDIDFSQRARCAGFRIRFVPDARMYHKETAASEKTADFYYTWGQSFTRYYRRHMKPFPVKLGIHLSYLICREAVTGHAAHVPALLKGTFSGLHQRMGDIPKLDAEFIDIT